MSINSISHLQWQSLNIFKLFKYLSGVCVLYIVLSFTNTAKAECQLPGFSNGYTHTYTSATLSSVASIRTAGYLFCRRSDAGPTEWSYLPYMCQKLTFPNVATSSTGKTLPFEFKGNAAISTRTETEALVSGSWNNGPTKPSLTTTGVVDYTYYAVIPAGSASQAAAGTYTATVFVEWVMRDSLGGCSGSATDYSGTSAKTYTFIVPSSCTVNSVSSMNFGQILSFGTASKDYVSTAAIRNTCTADTQYTLYLGNGNNRIAGGMRRMANGSNYIPYQLYKDANYSTVWDATGGTTSINGSGGKTLIGTAGPETSTIYGKIPKGTNISSVSGTYTDTIVVTLAY